MIGFLKGKIYSLEQQQVIIDVNGVGYEVYMTTPEILSLREGQETLIYTHYHLKEDFVALFGFLDKKLKEVFELLTSVSGLGPKTAISILSKVSINELVSGIYQGDVSALTKIPGIGNKIAGRIILELQDKLEDSIGVVNKVSVESKGDNKGIIKDAESALLFLGYNKKEIDGVLGKLLKRNKDEMDLDKLIRDALKELGK